MDQTILFSLIFLTACVAVFLFGRLLLKRSSWSQVLKFAFQHNAKLVVFEAGMPPRLQIDGEFQRVNAPPQSAGHLEEIRAALRASPTLSVPNFGVAVARRNEPTVIELELKPGQSAVRRG